MPLRDARNAAPVQRGGGQVRHGLGLVINANVDVPHGQFDVRVPGQLLSFWQARPVAEQFRNVRVASGRVEIGDAVVGFIRDANPLQIELDHQPGFPTFQQRKQFFGRLESFQPIPQHGDQFGMQRQNVFLPVFRGRGFHRDRGRVAVQIETPGCQAPQFLPPDAGHVGQEINPRPLLAIKPLDDFAAISGRLDQLSELLAGQCPPLVPHVHIDVEPFQANQRIDQKPFGRDAPIAESVDGLQVMVVGPWAKIVGLAQRPHEVCDGFGGDVRQLGEFGPRNDPPQSRHRVQDVLSTPLRQARFKRFDVRSDGRLLRFGEPLLIHVNHSGAAQPGFRFQLQRELLG